MVPLTVAYTCSRLNPPPVLVAIVTVRRRRDGMHMPGYGDAAVRVVVAESERKAFEAFERIRRKGDEIFDVRWLQPGRISNWPPLVLADQLDDPDVLGIDWEVPGDEFGVAELTPQSHAVAA